MFFGFSQVDADELQENFLEVEEELAWDDPRLYLSNLPDWNEVPDDDFIWEEDIIACTE